MVKVSSDSLLVRCGLAAAAYYVPQDLGVFALLSVARNSASSRLTGPRFPGPPEDKLDSVVFNFMADRSFTPAYYGVTKGRRFTVVDLYD